MSIEKTGQPNRAAHGGGAGTGFIAVLLVGTLIAGVAAPPVQAKTTEQKLLSITKTTIYGALLGGLLGLAGALVVKESARDDTIRWGVAVGSIAGFAYGIMNQDDEDSGDFSLRLPARMNRQGLDRDLVHGWRLGSYPRGRQTHDD